MTLKLSSLSQGYGTLDGTVVFDSSHEIIEEEKEILAELNENGLVKLPAISVKKILPPSNSNGHLGTETMLHDELPQLAPSLHGPGVPKTFSTRSGALVLFSEDGYVHHKKCKKRNLFRDFNALNFVDVIEPRDVDEITLEKFQQLLLSFDEEVEDEQLLTRLWSEKLKDESLVDVRPGFSPNRYMASMSKFWDPTIIDRLLSEKKIHSATLKKYLASSYKLPMINIGRKNNLLHSKPRPYSIVSLPELKLEKSLPEIDKNRKENSHNELAETSHRKKISNNVEPATISNRAGVVHMEKCTTQKTVQPKLVQLKFPGADITPLSVISDSYFSNMDYGRFEGDREGFISSPESSELASETESFKALKVKLAQKNMTSKINRGHVHDNAFPQQPGVMNLVLSNEYTEKPPKKSVHFQRLPGEYQHPVQSNYKSYGVSKASDGNNIGGTFKTGTADLVFPDTPAVSLATLSDLKNENERVVDGGASHRIKSMSISSECEYHNSVHIKLPDIAVKGHSYNSIEGLTEKPVLVDPSQENVNYALGQQFYRTSLPSSKTEPFLQNSEQQNVTLSHRVVLPAIPLDRESKSSSLTEEAGNWQPDEGATFLSIEGHGVEIGESHYPKDFHRTHPFVKQPSRIDSESSDDNGYDYDEGWAGRNYTENKEVPFNVNNNGTGDAYQLEAVPSHDTVSGKQESVASPQQELEKKTIVNNNSPSLNTPTTTEDITSEDLVSEKELLERIGSAKTPSEEKSLEKPPSEDVTSKAGVLSQILHSERTPSEEVPPEEESLEILAGESNQPDVKLKGNQLSESPLSEHDQLDLIHSEPVQQETVEAPESDQLFAEDVQEIQEKPSLYEQRDSSTENGVLFIGENIGDVPSDKTLSRSATPGSTKDDISQSATAISRVPSEISVTLKGEGSSKDEDQEDVYHILDDISTGGEPQDVEENGIIEKDPSEKPDIDVTVNGDTVPSLKTLSKEDVFRKKDRKSSEADYVNALNAIVQEVKTEKKQVTKGAANPITTRKGTKKHKQKNKKKETSFQVVRVDNERAPTGLDTKPPEPPTENMKENTTRKVKGVEKAKKQNKKDTTIKRKRKGKKNIFEDFRRVMAESADKSDGKPDEDPEKQTSQNDNKKVAQKEHVTEGSEKNEITTSPLQIVNAESGSSVDVQKNLHESERKSSTGEDNVAHDTVEDSVETKNQIKISTISEAKLQSRKLAAEKRRLEVERRRLEKQRERERAAEEAEREEKLRQEAEEEKQRRIEEYKRRKEEEEHQKKIEEEQERERQRKLRNEKDRERRQREEEKKKREQMLAQLRLEEEMKKERERIAAEVEKELKQQEEEMLERLAEDERQLYLEKQKEEEEERKILEEQKLVKEKELKEAENKDRERLLKEVAELKKKIIQRNNFIEKLKQSGLFLSFEQKLSKAFTFSYFEQLPELFGILPVEGENTIQEDV